ncbi:MAG: fimbrillin family protein [Bacteroidales bacterium]
MKKNYLMGLATLAMIMAGCSQNEVLNSEINGESNVIGFSTYTGKTKGTPVTAEAGLHAGGFGVAAFLGVATTPYMGKADAGASISWKLDKWDYTDTKDTRYWPASGALKFYAYAPFDNTKRTAGPTYSTAGMTFTNYTVPTTFADQEDFMYASNLTAISGSSVALPFNHALTQILFTVAATGNLRVDIAANGIEIHNVMSKGTFSLTSAATPVASWAPSATDKGTYQLTSTEVTDITSNTSTTTPAVIGTSLMLMPQTLTAWNPNVATIKNNDSGAKNTYLKINCKIFDINADAYILGTGTAYEPTYVPFGGFGWAMSEKITYALSFGGGFDIEGKPILKPITFTPTVEPWTEGTGSTIPLN